MKKHIICIIVLLVLATAFFFSGCSSPYSGVYRSTTGNTSAGISAGIASSDPRTAEKKERESLEIGPVSNRDAYYQWFEGLKIAYDATDSYHALLNASFAPTLLEEIDAYLVNGYSNFSVETFLANSSNVEYTQEIVSRALWVENIIDQYELLAKLILSDLVGEYGLGLNENSSVASIFYPQLSLNENKTPTQSNFINCFNETTIDSLSLPNPNFGTTFEYNDEQYIVFDLKNGKISIGGDERSADIPESLIDSFSSWNFNLISDDDVLNYVANSISFSNPFYFSSASSPDLQSYSTLYIISNVANSKVNYSLSFIAPQASSLNQDSFMQKYIEKYSLYLAYKILECSSVVPYQARYNGEPSVISKIDFIPLIIEYLNLGGHLGFIEKDWDISILGDISMIDSITDLIMNEFVGFDDIDMSNYIASVVEKRLNQCVVSLNGATLCVEENILDSSALFLSMPNIEWIDIPKSILIPEENGENPDNDNDDDNEIIKIPEGNIVSVVFMTGEVIEQERYFECIMLVLATSFAPVELTTYFRYVYNGEEQIYSLFDYSLNEEPFESLAGTEIKIENNFLGEISTLDEDGITQKYANDHFLYLPCDLIDAESESDAKKYILSGFKNNFSAQYLTSMNTMNAPNVYAYDSEKGAVYYNDISSNCDFVELSFVATSDFMPKYFFDFQDFFISDIEQSE